MSREIKFRAWHLKEKRYLSYDENWVLAPEDSLDKSYKLDICLVDFSNNDIISDEDCILEQYTGLKDKNGKEIYEGDIVVLSNFTRETGGVMAPLKVAVKWDEECCGYVLGCTMLGGKVLLCSRDDYIVVGNIHENPELLKRS